MGTNLDLLFFVHLPTLMDHVLPRLPSRAPTLSRRPRHQRLPVIPVYQPPKALRNQQTRQPPQPTPDKKQLVDARLKLYEISGTQILGSGVILNLKWHSRNNNWPYFERLSFGREDDKWMESYQTTHTRAPYILEKKRSTNIAKWPKQGQSASPNALYFEKKKSTNIVKRWVVQQSNMTVLIAKQCRIQNIGSSTIYVLSCIVTPLNEALNQAAEQRSTKIRTATYTGPF